MADLVKMYISMQVQLLFAICLSLLQVADVSCKRLLLIFFFEAESSDLFVLPTFDFIRRHWFLSFLTRSVFLDQQIRFYFLTSDLAFQSLITPDLEYKTILSGNSVLISVEQ